MLRCSRCVLLTALFMLALVACGSPAATEEPASSLAADEPVASEAVVAEQPIPSVEAAASAAAPTLQESPRKDVYAVGDTARVNDMLIHVEGVELGATSDLGEPQPGQQFVLVDITVENASGEQREIAPLLHMAVEDGAGQSYALDATAGMGFLSINGSIEAGESVTASLGYAVPQDAQDLRWIFRTTEPDAAAGIKETGKAVFDITP